MTKFNTIRDFLWVLQAFLRGKLLRQKAYRPQGNFFRLPVPVTANRITMLMKWWGRRPMTLNEAKALMEQVSKQDDDSGASPSSTGPAAAGRRRTTGTTGATPTVSSPFGTSRQRTSSYPRATKAIAEVALSLSLIF